jgi:chromosome segregation ATPase
MNPTLCTRLIRRLGWLALLPTLGLSTTGTDLRVDRAKTESMTLLDADVQKVRQIKKIDELQNFSIATISSLSTQLKAADDNLKAKQKELDAAYAAAKAQYARLKANIAELTAEKNQIEAERQAAREEAERQQRDFNSQLADLQRQKQALQDELAKLGQGKEAILAENQQLLEANAGLAREKDHLGQEITDLSVAKNDLAGKVAKLRDELEWKSLLTNIFSGSTVASALAVLGFFQSRRRVALENEKLLAEIKQLRGEPPSKP